LLYAEAASALQARDLYLAPIIEREGLCTIKPHTNYYQDLVESIISQQLSVKAAASILRRFVALFGDSFPAPEAILEKSVDELRAVGLSRPKATYIRDLAQHVIDGSVHFKHLDALSNEEIIQELTAVKGIGEWTVHMFLMFCMGRPDVLAWGDLGIRSGIKKVYNLDHLPSPAEVATIARRYQWHPYETIACWYIWRALDNKPAIG
jgi:DNA-3-methyladenine glycosylase II